MPFGEVKLVPGIDTESTPTDGEASISQANLIRWKFGLVEKIGGWTRYYPFTIGSIPREFQPWQDLNGTGRLAIGATASLNVITAGVNGVITPQITTTNSTASFSTTTSSPTITIIDNNASGQTTNNAVFVAVPVSISGIVLSGIYPLSSIVSSTSYTITAASNATGVATGGVTPLYTTTNASQAVVVDLANHGKSVGDTYYAAVSTSVGGVTIAGTYLVTAATTSTFTIIAGSQATSNSTGYVNGGLPRLVYYITQGSGLATAGYGVGGYGDGGYGTGVAPATGAGTPIMATDWTMGNWGEILLACPMGGGIYQWGPSSGYTTGSLITQAPISNVGMFITMPQQIVVAYGCAFSDGAPGPLRVKWSTAGDYTNWTASSTSFAGSYTIPRGSKIVGGLQGATQNYIWTDLAVWSMQYVNLPYVFSFNEIMSGCGLIGQHAAVLAEGTIFWMSQKQFFSMTGGGGPQQLPCKVWDVIFQDLDTANAYKIRAGANSAFNEIWWHFPSLSGGSGENDSYVKFNLVEGEWDYGSLPTGRSAWVDQSVLGAPIGGDPDGIIYQHESGYNGDGAALNPFFQTGYWTIGTGEEFAFVDQVLPDFTYGTHNAAQTATPQLTIYSTDYPNGAVTTHGPYAFGSTVEKVSTRVRGRQMAIRVDSSDSDSFWRLGLIRFRYAQDGRR